MHEVRMMETKSAREADIAADPNLTDAGVKKKTGRTWHEWFALLDRDGAATLDRRRITRIVASKYGIGLWWRRTIARAYEEARLTRGTEEQPAGLVVNASRTIQRPMRALSATLHGVEARARRLKSRALGNRAAPGTISSGASSSAGNVDVSGDRFEVPPSESDLTPDATRDVRPVQKMRAVWKARVDSLQKSLAKKPAT
jgi:hypothetical protein